MTKLELVHRVSMLTALKHPDEVLTLEVLKERIELLQQDIERGKVW